MPLSNSLLPEARQRPAQSRILSFVGWSRRLGLLPVKRSGTSGDSPAGIELVSIRRADAPRHWKSMSNTKVASKSFLGDEIVGRINQLGTISETPEHLARVFLSPEHRIAADLILSWM